MSTEERTCLKQMRKTVLKYPVKIQVPIKITHTISPHLISCFSFPRYFIDYFLMTETEETQFLNSLGLAQKVKLGVVNEKKLTKATD